MVLEADLAFGVETVKVGDVAKTLDVCGLADELYDAMEAVPADTPPLKELDQSGRAAAAVFLKHGFPEITVPATAYRFASQVMARALDVKKAAGDVWPSADGPASPDTSDSIPVD